MFKIHRGTCVSETCKHPENVYIVVKAGLCAKCNYDKKQAQKKAAGKKTGQYRYVKKATGESDLFADLSAERDWVCFVTGTRMNHLTPTSFLHVLPKALNRFPLFKLNPKNIVLALDEIHHRWDHTPRSTLTEPYWQKLFDLEAELKLEYENLKKSMRLQNL